jgi:hypothetical protein
MLKRRCRIQSRQPSYNTNCGESNRPALSLCST